MYVVSVRKTWVGRNRRWSNIFYKILVEVFLWVSFGDGFRLTAVVWWIPDEQVKIPVKWV